MTNWSFFVSNNKEINNIEHLYRYQKIDEHLKTVLTENILYFCSPKDFNDPFDCQYLVTFKDCEEDDFKDFLTRVFKYSCPNYRIEDIIRKVEDCIALDMHKNQVFLKEKLKIYQNLIKNDIDKLGMLCLSENKDDILMWSHYADRHEGVCLQFDKRVIDERFLNRIPNILEKVEYRKSYPSLRKYNNSSEVERAKLTMFTKESEHWNYEKEWRIITHPKNEKERKIKYPEEMLTGIIFGCRITDEKKCQVKGWLKERKIKPKLYQASINEDEYALVIDEKNTNVKLNDRIRFN